MLLTSTGIAQRFERQAKKIGSHFAQHFGDGNPVAQPVTGFRHSGVEAGLFDSLHVYRDAAQIDADRAVFGGDDAVFGPGHDARPAIGEGHLLEGQPDTARVHNESAHMLPQHLYVGVATGHNSGPSTSQHVV